MRFRADLGNRVYQHHVERRKARSAETSVEHKNSAFIHGDYRNGLFKDEMVVADRQENNELSGIEETLLRQINQVAAVKQQAGDISPVVILDFGGMYGLSMIRLANDPSLKERVARGKVVFVVSNLEFKPPSTVDEFIELIVEDPKFDDVAPMDLLLEYELVQYVQGDAQELKKQSVCPDPRSEPIALRGHVDIIHEHIAMAHSLKPDIDLAHLGKLLSRYGTLFLESSNSFRNSDDDEDPTPEYIDQGLANMAEQGFHRANLGERSSNYVVMQADHAPQLAV